MLKPKLVLFDIGGVLIDYTAWFQTASRDLDIPIDLIKESFKKYKREITICDITPQQMFANCIADNNLAVDDQYDFTKSWVRDYKKIQSSYELFINLSKTYQVGFLSNIYKGLVPMMLNERLLPNVPNSINFHSCDIGLKKPEIEMYEYVQDKTGYSKNEIFFIDDQKQNLAPVQSLCWQMYNFEFEKVAENVYDLTRRLL